MKELVQVRNENGELLVSGRELHKGLGINTPYTQWFERMCDYGFEENVDYISFSQKSEKPQGGRPSVDHVLKIDMAKEIAMIQRNDKGREIRKYFIECEKRLREQTPMLSAKEQLQLKLFSKDSLEVVNAHKELVAIEVAEATAPLLAQIEESEPLVSFAERVIKDGDNILVRELAKIACDEGYHIGERKLYNKLREWGYICKHSTEPKQSVVDRGYFVVETGIKPTPYGGIQYFTTKVTPKGQVHIIEKLLKENR